jgi:ribosomal protein L29
VRKSIARVKTVLRAHEITAAKQESAS